jgi:protein tyrosine/serine phosphatase
MLCEKIARIAAENGVAHVLSNGGTVRQTQPNPSYNAARAGGVSKNRWNKRTWLFSVTSTLLMGSVALLVWNLRENFHAVIPGQVYRSGQPGPDSLAAHIAEYGLRSIINVRGGNPDAEWYREERAVAANHNVQYLDLSTDSACPLPDEVRALVPILQTCPKPVLVHCQSGIDRSGPVAAMCILLLNEGPDALTQAHEQLGLRYGHISWRANTIRQQAFLSLYERWLTQNRYSHTSAHFCEWALGVYAKSQAS